MTQGIYRPIFDGLNPYSYRQLYANLADKLANPEFLDDIHNLTRNLHGYEHYHHSHIRTT